MTCYNSNCYNRNLLAWDLSGVCQCCHAVLCCAALLCCALLGCAEISTCNGLSDRNQCAWQELLPCLSCSQTDDRGVQSNVHDLYHHRHLQKGHRAAMSHHCLSHDHCSSPLLRQPHSSASCYPPLLCRWTQRLQSAANSPITSPSCADKCRFIG